MSAPPQMSATSLGWKVTVQPGTYFLGDPCYAVPSKKWSDLLGSCNFFANPVGTIDGFQVLAFGTQWGDGTYSDGQGGSYPVDAGLIGLTPINLASTRPDYWALSNMGRIVTFTDATQCRSENGKLQFGGFCINTTD